MKLLSHNEYYGLQYTDESYEDSEFEYIEFHECTFKRCSFERTQFKSCIFISCRFDACKFSLAKIDDSTFTHNHFEDSQLVGINWSLASDSDSKMLKPFDFYKCILNYSIFMGTNLREISIVGCMVKEADFSDANLSRVNASESDFSGSRFVQTNLTEADFSSARNYRINASHNILKRTKFSLPEAMSLLHSLDIELVE